MKNKTISNYKYELKGVLLSAIVLAILVLTDVLTQWLPKNNAWLAGLICVAAVVATFVIIMYKRVTILKKYVKNDNA